MSENDLQLRFRGQKFANDYELIDGVEMHRANADHFQIPHPVLKKHLAVGQFVELRIDSSRFSVHEDTSEKCSCPSCNAEMTKPILRHEHPASLVPLPPQKVPSRGWGEDFWVQITARDGDWFEGTVDNPLVESRLHEINQGDSIVFHADYVLAVHTVHRQELVLEMDATDLRDLADWLRGQL